MHTQRSAARQLAITRSALGFIFQIKAATIYFISQSSLVELLVEEADSLLAAQRGHGPVSLPCMLSLPRKVVKTQEDAVLTIQANLVLWHL